MKDCVPTGKVEEPPAITVTRAGTTGVVGDWQFWLRLAAAAAAAAVAARAAAWEWA